jgi:HlyD family secretion protein
MTGTLSKRVWLLVIAAVLIVVGLLYFNSRRPAPRISTVRVTRGTLSSSITTNGTVEPVMPYSLRAKFDGFVVHVVATEGQKIRAGQPLLTLNDNQVRAQLDEAKAQLASEEEDLRVAQAGGRSDQATRLAGEIRAAQAQRDMLQHQQDALVKLLPQKAATQQELDNNRADFAKADAELEQFRKEKQEFEHRAQLDKERLALLVSKSRAEVADLQQKVDSARVVSPISGTLYSLPVHDRDFVHTGDLVADIADLTRVRVRAYIDEPELGQLQPNQAVEVTWSALPERTWTGVTETMPRQVVARGTRNVGEVLCSISNEKMELIPNTTVDVRIQLSERTGALLVARGAVQIVGQHRYVYEVADGRLHRQDIRVGISDATHFEVLSGLQEGETLALSGSAPFQDNMAVNVENQQ